MLHIEPIEEVITKRKLIVEIDEDEIAKILVDARPFQKQLRQERAKWSGSRAVRKAVHPKAVKKEGKPGVKCPKCHKVFKALGRHLSVCTGDKDPFGAAARSVPEE